LPGRITPQTAWDATEIAEPPRPAQRLPESIIIDPATAAPGTPLEGLHPRRVKSNGTIDIKDVSYQIARELSGHTIYISTRAEGVKIYDNTGVLLLEHPWPPPGTKHVSNGRPRGAGSRRPQNIAEALRPADRQPDGEYRRTVRSDGRVSIRNVVYGISRNHTGEELHAIVGDTVTFWSTRTGELIAEHAIPKPGIKHVGYTRYNRKPPAPGQTPPNPEPSPMS
jgi:hypothetical protein